jgi:hypothetical protein
VEETHITSKKAYAHPADTALHQRCVPTVGPRRHTVPDYIGEIEKGL